MGKRLLSTCCLALVVVPHLLGCKAKSEIPPLHPVKGQVLVNKSPAEGVDIILYPVNAEDRDEKKWKVGFPRARTEEDGSFVISSFGKNDGAPKGAYLVLARWTEGEGEKITDRLRGRYFNPERPAQKIEVSEQNNELTIQLSN